MKRMRKIVLHYDIDADKISIGGRKVKFKDIFEKVRSINGISTPLFGITWNNKSNQRQLAREIIRFLEDKRALYIDCAIIEERHCVISIRHIRDFLTEKSFLATDAVLLANIQTMRKACRDFYNELASKNLVDSYCDMPSISERAAIIILRALVELRIIFGQCILRISLYYELDIDDDLYTICNWVFYEKEQNVVKCINELNDEIIDLANKKTKAV